MPCIQITGKNIQKSIRNYFEYLPLSPPEVAWGFRVSACGFTRVGRGGKYPPSRHPEGHDFTWERGRVLPALQLIFISEGRGRYEWRDGARDLEAGECFLVLPGQWHRYRPDKRTGWVEHWFELRGALVEQWLEGGLFLPLSPVFRVRDPRWIRDLFEQMHEYCLEKPRGSRPVMAGLAMTLLAGATSGGGSQREEGKVGRAELIRKAQVLLSRPHPEGVAAIARKLGVSYSTFHRQFLEETGLRPKQYADQMRLARAEELLLASGLSIKEIAVALGFHSAFHFSACFKKHAGRSPDKWRRSLR